MSHVRTRLLAAVLGAMVLAATAATALAQDWMGYYAYPGPGRAEYVGTTGYWTAPDRCGNWSASLYPSPRPVPAYVGHVFYTYEPLYPHHYFNAHSHRYFRKGTFVRVRYSN